MHPFDYIQKLILSLFLATLCCEPAFSRAQAADDLVVIRGSIEIFTVMDEWAGGEGGVELAVHQRGTLMGHPVAIRSVGSGCDFGISPEAVEKFVRRYHPLIVIGPSCSHTALDVAKSLSDAKVLAISPSATDEHLTDPQLRQPYFFRTAPNDKFEGVIGARFANEALAIESAGIFYMDPDPEIFPEIFHQTPLRLRDDFRENFTGTIADSIAIPEPFPFEDSFSIFEEGLDRFEQEAPDLALVYGPLYHENIQFDEGGVVALNHVLRARDPSGEIAVLSSEGLIHGAGLLYYYILEVFHEALPKEIYATGTNFSGGPSYKDFLSAFIAFGGEEPNRFNRYASLAYDATNLALRALALVAVDDRKGNLIISREALRKAMEDPGNYRPPVKGAAAVYHAPMNGDFNPEGYAVFKAMEEGVSTAEEGNFLLVWSP